MTYSRVTIGYKQGDEKFSPQIKLLKPTLNLVDHNLI